MKKFKNLFLIQTFAFFVLTITFSAHATTANLQASVNHNVVHMGQEIEFTLTLNNQSASGQPDFVALTENFDILSGASQRNSKNFINGSFSSSASWTIVITPKEEGSIVIPPISYASLTSEPIIIVVGKAPTGSSPDVFFETNISENQVYVQALLRLDLKLYIKKSNLSNTQLDPLASPDAKIIQVGKDRQSEVLKNGIPYFLVERSFFIFPERSGTLRIPSIRFQGVISEGSRYSNYGKRRRISANSEAKTIKVLGIPDSFPENATWLPAEQILLKDTFSPGMAANTGDPITRTIITEAKGLNASALPPMEINDFDGLKVYPDQGTSDEQLNLNSLSSTRTDAFALIANQPGTLALPAIEIPWWDTKQDKLRYARIEAKNLNIKGSNTNSSTQEKNNNLQNEAETNIDLALANTSTQPPELQISENSFSQNSFILLISVFLVTWILTVLFFIFRIQKMKKFSIANNQTNQDLINTNAENLKSIKFMIKTACKDHKLRALRESLIYWSKAQFPEMNTYGLSSISSHINNSELTGSDLTYNDLASQLKLIDDQLYSNNSEEFSFENFYDIFKKANKEIEKSDSNKNTEKGTALESLYQTHS